MLKGLLSIAMISFVLTLFAQEWQQRVVYGMEIDFDVQTHRFTGTQQLTYFNNSPDTLTQVFYHLFFNAFQPGSDMDTWNQVVPDPDMRLERIGVLQSHEQGYLNIKSISQRGTDLTFIEKGTILKAELAIPLYPGDSTFLMMDFTGQVPIQIRRSGRDNAEGISYSMSQWYPKLCAYDQDGWHPDEYIGREFYGDFGDFDVKINIDKKFSIAATGHLQNGNQIGYGYEDPGMVIPVMNLEKRTWHFHAEDVHDFVWAADPDYTHVHHVHQDGTVFRFFYQKNTYTEESWSELPDIMDHAYDFLNIHFGQYPYRGYSFIQAGDSGMEYPMATLITGNRSLISLVGVAVHELVHSWYHTVLATNELRYAWMDEGFTNYVTILTMTELYKAGLLQGEHTERNFESDYKNYVALANLGIEEPMSTHANYFSTNTAYYGATYAKGCVFLAQLEYIIGTKALQNVMLRYFNTWKFMHPRPEDFICIAEDESGLILDWYYDYWILSTKTIDYHIESVQPEGSKTSVTLYRTGEMPMPLEIVAKTKKGTEFKFYLPLDLAHGSKPVGSPEWTVLDAWPSVNPGYIFSIPLKFSQLATIEIDPSGRMADVDRTNNVFTVTAEEE